MTSDPNFIPYLLFHFSHTLSSIFIVFALIINLIIYKINKRLSIKINYRIAILVLCSDVIYLVFQYLSRYSNNDASCLASAWGVIFSTLVSMFYTIAIAVNLQLTFVHYIHTNRYIILSYYILPFILALIISLLPVFVGEVGLHKINGSSSCWYKKANGNGWMYGTFHGWILFTVAYCFLIVLIIIIKVYRKRYLFQSEFRNSIAIDNEANSSAILRVLLYPAVPVFCYLLIMISLFVPKLPDTFIYVADFFQNLQGFINAVIFLSSPVFSEEINNAKTRLARSLNTKISLYPTSKMFPLWIATYDFLTLDANIRSTIIA